MGEALIVRRGGGGPQLLQVDEYEFLNHVSEFRTALLYVDNYGFVPIMRGTDVDMQYEILVRGFQDASDHTFLMTYQSSDEVVFISFDNEDEIYLHLSIGELDYGLNVLSEGNVSFFIG